MTDTYDMSNAPSMCDFYAQQSFFYNSLDDNMKAFTVQWRRNKRHEWETVKPYFHHLGKKFVARIPSYGIPEEFPCSLRWCFDVLAILNLVSKHVDIEHTYWRIGIDLGSMGFDCWFEGTLDRDGPFSEQYDGSLKYYCNVYRRGKIYEKLFENAEL